jgi:crossover junction endodeoxyribonuclease RuvC
MRIIGIDPGSRKTGFGVIDVSMTTRQLQHVAHGVLRLDVERDIAERVRELAFRLKELIALHAPTHCALEDIFVSEGLRSALILGQARGAVLATMGLHDVPVQNFPPTKVKLALTGAGRASKLQVAQIVRIVLKIDDKMAEDAGDALAIAICCANHSVFLNDPSIKVLPTTKRLTVKKQRDALADIARRQGRIP